MWETICEKLLEAVVRESGTPVLTVQCTSAFCYDVWLALVQDEHTGTWLLYHSTMGRRRLNRLEFCADMRAKRETGNAPDSGAYYRNLDYALQGPASLAPSEATDNGRFTVLRFPGGQALPVVHLVEADGQERLAAYDVRGEFIVIHAVAGQIRLRRGREVVCIWNLAYVPTHGGAPSRTASPDVRRTEPPRPAP